MTPECAVAGIDQLDGRLDNAMQNALQVEASADHEYGVEQTLGAVSASRVCAHSAHRSRRRPQIWLRFVSRLSDRLRW